MFPFSLLILAILVAAIVLINDTYRTWFPKETVDKPETLSALELHVKECREKSRKQEVEKRRSQIHKVK